MKCILLLLFLILFGHLLLGQAPLPPIYFSHVTLWVDPATYQAVRESDFLRNHFSAVETRTTETQHGIVPTYTGTYLYGKRTYIEFIVAGSVPSQTTRVGELSLGMWADNIQSLPSITDSLVAHTDAAAAGGTRTLTVNGREIRWFEDRYPLFPEENELTADACVLGIYPSYLWERYGNLRPDQDGTTREKALQFSNQPERMLKDVTGITLVLRLQEIERLIQEFEAFGYKIRSEAGKQIAQGPEIEFVLIPAAGKQPNNIAIEMALNQSKSGETDHRFGEAYLHFDDKTATLKLRGAGNPNKLRTAQIDKRPAEPQKNSVPREAWRRDGKYRFATHAGRIRAPYNLANVNNWGQRDLYGVYVNPP
jgi:hypothetical protein